MWMGAALAAPVALDAAELVGLSEVIVTGRVRALEVVPWGPARMPVTVVHVDVADAWKGAPGPALSFVQAGGPLPDGRWVMHSGAVRYEAGQSVLLFLERSATGALVTAGQDQGALDASGAALAGLWAVSGDPPAEVAPFRGWTLLQAQTWVLTHRDAPWPVEVPRAAR